MTAPPPHLSILRASQIHALQTSLLGTSGDYPALSAPKPAASVKERYYCSLWGRSNNSLILSMGPMITPTGPGSHMSHSASTPGLQPQDGSNPFSHHDSANCTPENCHPSPIHHTHLWGHDPPAPTHTHTLLLTGSLTRTMTTNWPTIQSFLLNPKWIKEFSAWSYYPSM